MVSVFLAKEQSKQRLYFTVIHLSDKADSQLFCLSIVQDAPWKSKRDGVVASSSSFRDY
jgi:hypothetical protein